MEQKTIYEPFLKFPSHEHQIIIHQTPRVWLAKRREEVLVTLGDDSLQLSFDPTNLKWIEMVKD